LPVGLGRVESFEGIKRDERRAKGCYQRVRKNRISARRWGAAIRNDICHCLPPFCSAAPYSTPISRRYTVACARLSLFGYAENCAKRCDVHHSSSSTCRTGLTSLGHASRVQFSAALASAHAGVNHGRRWEFAATPANPRQVFAGAQALKCGANVPIQLNYSVNQGGT
jgi:hypothetical protein